MLVLFDAADLQNRTLNVDDPMCLILLLFFFLRGFVCFYVMDGCTVGLRSCTLSFLFYDCTMFLLI